MQSPPKQTENPAGQPQLPLMQAPLLPQPELQLPQFSLSVDRFKHSLELA